MENQNRILLMELCHIAHTRNEINARRHRARYRKNYYENAVRVVEAHNGTNSELRKLNPTKHAARILAIKNQMYFLKKKYPVAKKWQDMGLHKLRSLSLKALAEYSMAKHETMELTIKTRERVEYLTNVLDVNLYYKNGSIYLMTKLVLAKQHKSIDVESFDLDKIEKLAHQHQLNLSVEEMIQE